MVEIQIRTESKEEMVSGKLQWKNDVTYVLENVTLFRINTKKNCFENHSNQVDLLGSGIYL